MKRTVEYRFDEVLGSRLRRLRLARGMTQRQLAEPRYTAAHISTIESGRRHPSRQAVAYLADKLDVSEEELLYGRSPALGPELTLELQEARRLASAGNVTDARRRYARVRRIAMNSGLVDVHAAAEQGLALCDFRYGATEDALERYEKAERLLASEPFTARVDAITGKAACLHRLGDLQHAIYVLERALENLVRGELPDPGALFKIHACLVGPCFDAGAYERAGRAAEAALELAGHCVDPERLGSMYMSTARTHLSQGDFQRARDSLRFAEAMFRRADLRLEVGQSHLALGFTLLHEDRLEEAEQQLHKARALFREVGSVVDEARTLCDLGRLSRRRQRTREAIAYLEEAVALAERDLELVTLATAYRELGLAKAQLDIVAAEKHLRDAILLFERASSRVELAHTHRLLGDMFYERGAIEAACEEYRAGVAVHDDLGLS